MRRTSVVCAILVTAALVVGRSAAGTDPSLCSPNTSRGAVPADFPLEACVDGNAIWLRNNLGFPIDLDTHGAVGKHSIISTDVTLEGQLTRHHFPKALMVLPGDVIRFQIGASFASVTASGASHAGYWALAKTVSDFLPAGASYDAYKALARAIGEFNDDFHQYAQCLGEHPSLLTQAKCKALLARNVAFAIARAAVTAGIRGLKGLILKPITFAHWVNAQVNDVKKLALSKHRTVSQAALSPHIVFDGSAGTGSPPFQLGPYNLQPFGVDNQDDLAVVSGVDGPTGSLAFSPELTHELVGVDWNTWSNGYTGDVYEINDGVTTTLTITLPSNTHAFDLYVEPQPYAIYPIIVTAQDGTTSGPVDVDGYAGAASFGFYAVGGTTLTTITINGPDDGSGFGVGEFAIG